MNCLREEAEAVDRYCMSGEVLPSVDHLINNMKFFLNSNAPTNQVNSYQYFFNSIDELTEFQHILRHNQFINQKFVFDTKATICLGGELFNSRLHPYMIIYVRKLKQVSSL